MKKGLGLSMVMVVLVAWTANAQAPISKAVNNVSNKKRIEQRSATSTEIDSRHNTHTAVVSKAVNRINYTAPVVEQNGNIKSVGTPAWVVSKGVHRDRKVDQPAGAPAQDNNQIARGKRN